MKRLKRAFGTGLVLSWDLYVLAMLYDAFVTGSEATDLIWERAPATFLVWWPVPLFGWPFDDGLAAILTVLLTNALLYTLLVYSFMWWRARNVRLP